jgi:hypothetical protein
MGIVGSASVEKRQGHDAEPLAPPSNGEVNNCGALPPLSCMSWGSGA